MKTFKQWRQSAPSLGLMTKVWWAKSAITFHCDYYCDTFIKTRMKVEYRLSQGDESAKDEIQVFETTKRKTPGNQTPPDSMKACRLCV